MKLYNFRKLDYIVFYVFLSIIYISQLANASLILIIKMLIVFIIPALILGSVTNIIFKKTSDKK